MKTKDAASCRFERLDILSDGDAAQLRKLVASISAGRFSTPTGAHCRLEDVVVDEKRRGRGLGRKIVERALAALHELGVEQVELTSRPSRVAANARIC